MEEALVQRSRKEAFAEGVSFLVLLGIAISDALLARADYSCA